MPNIPVSELTNVQPGVIGTGGSPLSLNSIFMTTSTLPPIGSVSAFADADSVGAFFGTTSPEYAAAQVYFLGYDNSPIKPGTIYFGQFATAAVSAYLRSASFKGVTLSQLQALSGSLTVTIDGAVKTAASINLSAATSFANAATIIGTALTATVTYNTQLQTFVISSATTGNASTITFASGTLAAGLKMTEATAAVTSQGSAIMTPGDAMDRMKTATTDWGLFTTIAEPDLDGKIAFAIWTNAQSLRYGYVGWDSSAAAKVLGSTATFAYAVETAQYEGVIPVYPSLSRAALICGVAASIQFARLNGRITFAYKGQAGLTPDVTDINDARALEANGYNFYGAYAEGKNQFNLLQPGQISGKWKWIDAFVNQIYFSSQLRLAAVSYLAQVGSVPYNDDGYTEIKAAYLDPINEMINFGGIRKGVPLSSAQASQVNSAAGVVISDTLETVGWYLQIQPATAQIRGNRASPVQTLWYTDGGSIQRLNLQALDVM